jgi:hypothetical protein
MLFYGRVYAAKKAIQGYHAKGMLPLHVLVVSVLYLALCFEILLYHYGRVHLPANFRLFLNLAIFAASNYGVWLVLKYEQLKYKPYKRLSQVQINESDPEPVDGRYHE